MLKKRDIVAAIEIGTSKIAVAAAETQGGGLQVLGAAEASSRDAVMKGEILDVELAFQQLGKALNEVESQCGIPLTQVQQVGVSVTGGDIYSAMNSIRGYSRSGKISQDDIDDAFDNAKRSLPLSPGQTPVNIIPSYYMVEGRRLHNPLDTNAGSFDVCNHCVIGKSAMVENFLDLVRDSGFEDDIIEPVFSAVADDMGIMTDEEREKGTVLVDIGAGTTEFAVEQQSGIAASGVLQIGFNHVFNDLSIAFDNSFDIWRQFTESGGLAAAFSSGGEPLVFPLPGGRKKIIPFSSVETVAAARLTEIMDIVYDMAAKQCRPESLYGGILTGGGALFPPAESFFRERFRLPCRIGMPFKDGAPVERLGSPRYTTLWGTLKVAACFLAQCDPAGGFGALFDAVLGKVSSSFLRKR